MASIQWCNKPCFSEVIQVKQYAKSLQVFCPMQKGEREYAHTEKSLGIVVR